MLSVYIPLKEYIPLYIPFRNSPKKAINNYPKRDDQAEVSNRVGRP